MISSLDVVYIYDSQAMGPGTSSRSELSNCTMHPCVVYTLLRSLEIVTQFGKFEIVL